MKARFWLTWLSLLGLGVAEPGWGQTITYGLWSHSVSVSTNYAYGIVTPERSATALAARNNGEAGTLTVYFATNQLRITNTPAGALSNIPLDVAIFTYPRGTTILVEDVSANSFQPFQILSNIAGSIYISNVSTRSYGNCSSAIATADYVYVMDPKVLAVDLRGGTTFSLSGKPLLSAGTTVPILVELYDASAGGGTAGATNAYLILTGEK